MPSLNSKSALLSLSPLISALVRWYEPGVCVLRPLDELNRSRLRLPVADEIYARVFSDRFVRHSLIPFSGRLDRLAVIRGDHVSFMNSGLAGGAVRIGNVSYKPAIIRLQTNRAGLCFLEVADEYPEISPSDSSAARKLLENVTSCV